jgi:hypothetical protein
LNRRALIQVLIILLFLSLIAFWQLAPAPKKTVKRKVIGGLSKKEIFRRQQRLYYDENVQEEPQQHSVSPPEQPKATIKPISHSGWINPQGKYEVFGMVQNNGEHLAHQVMVTVIFKDLAWQRVGEVSALVDQPTLPPGAKSAFKVVLNNADGKAVGSYVLLTSAR